MNKRLILFATIGVAFYFWLLDWVAVERDDSDARPFFLAMHAISATVSLLAVSSRHRTFAMAVGLAAVISLWVVKLFTVEVHFDDDPTVGVALRAIPAMHNRLIMVETIDHVFLSADCNNYLGQDLYWWLVEYGYLWGTALSAVLLILWLRNRPRPAPALSSCPTPQRTAYRD